MSSFLRRIASLTQYGPKRTVQTIISVIDDALFEWRYGTNTVSRVNQSELKVISPEHQEQAKPYFPTRGRALRHAFGYAVQHCGVSRQAGLVDIGSGKGYAVMNAALFGFARVTGVEFAPELVNIARANLDKIRQRLRVDQQVDIICADATAHSFGPNDCVFFLYNPFGADIMRGFATQVARSLEQYPRDIYFIYAGPDFVKVIYECLPVREVGQTVYGGFDFLILSNRK